MKVSAHLLVVASLLLLSGVTVAHAHPSNSGGSAAVSESTTHVALTGYVRQGEFRDSKASKPIRYLYLELKQPVGKYVSHLKSSYTGQRDVELVAGSSAVIYKLEALVGKRVIVRGELPFVFDANAPRVVLPLVMSVDTASPRPLK